MRLVLHQKVSLSEIVKHGKKHSPEKEKTGRFGSGNNYDYCTNCQSLDIFGFARTLL